MPTKISPARKNRRAGGAVGEFSETCQSALSQPIAETGSCIRLNCEAGIGATPQAEMSQAKSASRRSGRQGGQRQVSVTDWSLRRGCGSAALLLLRLAAEKPALGGRAERATSSLPTALITIAPASDPILRAGGCLSRRADGQARVTSFPVLNGDFHAMSSRAVCRRLHAFVTE